MGSKEKLIERFKSIPMDFTWDELLRLFHILGFELKNKGKTSGSRDMFVKGSLKRIIHKPHPQKFIKEYIMKETLQFLENNNLI